MNTKGRTTLRLRLRDVSAAAAFLSIALSGAVPTWALLTFGGAWLLSMLGQRPLAGRTAWSVLFLLLTAVLLFGAAFRGLLDLVVSACTFAGLVTCHRMLSAPTASTDQQVHLTSLLMLAGGAALSGEMWFALCLTAFAITATLAMGLSVLEGPNPDAEVPVAPVVRRLSTAVTLAMVGGVLFFVFFPRLSWNIAARRVPPGIGGNTTGMADSVRLGGSGNLKSSPRVVARVKISPDPGRDALNAYFIGRTFDGFDGREWLGSGHEQPAQGRVMLGKVFGSDVRQTWELLPAYGARTLVALETPLLFYDAFMLNTSGQSRTALVHVPGEEVRFSQSANAYLYTVHSTTRERAVSMQEPDAERYTQLPEKLDPRVRELAARVVGNEKRPRQAAQRLVSWLQKEMSYSLELSEGGSDPLVEFLFDRKQGHCEHFATALTVMLRAEGFNARVAAGFFGGERVGERYLVRAGDAHAWTQVWVPDEGWTTVDATPDSGRGSQPLKFLAWATARYEALEEWWRQRVVDYSFQDQIEIARALVRPPRDEAERTEAAAGGPSEREPLFAALGAAALTYLLVQLLLRRRRRVKPHPAASFLDEIERRLRKAGVSQRDDEPLEELSKRLDAATHRLAPAVHAATAAYLAARFGGQPLPPARRAQLLTAISTPPSR